MNLALHLIREREHLALLDRAKLRALERQTGQATDDDGSYWLARTAALERVAEQAGRLLAGRATDGDVREALERLDTIQARACRNGDHQVAA